MYFHFSHFQFSFLVSIHFFKDSAASSSPWCFLNVVPVVPHDFHPLRHHAFEQCFPGSDTGHTALRCVQRPQKFGWGPRRRGDFSRISWCLEIWKVEKWKTTTTTTTTTTTQEMIGFWYRNAMGSYRSFGAKTCSNCRCQVDQLAIQWTSNQWCA